MYTSGWVERTPEGSLQDPLGRLRYTKPSPPTDRAEWKMKEILKSTSDSLKIGIISFQEAQVLKHCLIGNERITITMSLSMRNSEKRNECMLNTVKLIKVLLINWNAAGKFQQSQH